MVLILLLAGGNAVAGKRCCPTRAAYFDGLWVPQDSLIKANGVRRMEDTLILIM